MSAILVALLAAWLAADPPKAGTNQPPPSTTSTNAAAAVEDPVEKEFRHIMELDDEALEEADKWIRGEVALNEKGAALTPEALTARIEARFQPVKDAYDDFLKRQPKHARAHLAYGSFLNEAHDEANALVHWEKSRELDPSNPAVWNNLANHYGHRSPVKKAFEYYAKAIELNPKEPIYYQNLATTVYLFRSDAQEFYQCNEQQVFDRALSLYAKALELDPKSFLIASDLAQSYYGIKPPRHEDALKAWDKALAVAQNDIEREGVHIHLARTLINMQRFDEARTHLNQVSLEGYSTLKTRVLKNLERKQEAASTNSVPAAVETPAAPAVPTPAGKPVEKKSE